MGEIEELSLEELRAEMAIYLGKTADGEKGTAAHFIDLQLEVNRRSMNGEVEKEETVPDPDRVFEETFD